LFLNLGSKQQEIIDSLVLSMLANPLCMLFKINLVKDYIPLVFSYVPCKRNGKMLGMTNDSEAFSLLVSNVMSSKSSSFALF